jgi:hypothetical protein
LRIARFEKTDFALAQLLHCSKRTINAHMRELRTKLKADSRSGVAMLVVGGAQCPCHPGWSEVLPVTVDREAVEHAS